jgi:hypothetical protein
MADVPPHGAALVAVRPAMATPQWAGDTVHISQGLIVERWKATRSSLSVDLALGHQGRGTAFLALPAPPARATLDASPVPWKGTVHGVYAFELRLEPRSALRVFWE